MTREELMKPRFEVIGDYPGLSYNVGDIIEILIDDSYGIIDMGIYPHLFRKLNWWELRKIEDMPKKLIYKSFVGKDDADIIDIIHWDMEKLVGIRKDGGYTSLRVFNPEYGYFPIDV